MILIVPVKPNISHGSWRSQVKRGSDRCHLSFLVLLALFLLGGCATVPATMLPLASIEGIQGHFRIGRIIHLETGKAVSFGELIAQLGPAELIFIGEVHDNPEHHLIQVQILQALIARYGPVTIGMESFQEHQQSVLDGYLHGDLTEEAFLRDVDWQNQWGLDYYFYRPLLLLVKEKGGRVLAINAPDRIVRKVARTGLNTLETREREQLAHIIDLDNKEHRAYLRGIYKEHPKEDLRKFDHFYEAQCVWEETMAENIAEYLEKYDQKMVVFTGNGHITNRYGIPDRTLRRIPVSTATIVLYPLTKRVTISKKTADYVWLTGNYPRRRLMVRARHRQSY